MEITNINLGTCPLQYLSVGYVGETGARPVSFDFSAWATEYGSGVLQLLLQRPGDADPYPVLLDIDGTTATWTPDATDTAAQGQGQAQLVYTVGGVIVKNAIFRVLIAPSLGAAGDPPEPYEDWLRRLLTIAAEAQQSAIDAAGSAEAAGTSAGAAAGSAGAAAQSALDAEAAKSGAEAAEQTAQQAAALARAKASEAAEAAQIAGREADYAQQQNIAAGYSAESAHDDAESAAQSAEDAQTASSAAQTAAAAAAASASAAAGSAADAAAAVTEVESKGAEQIQAIGAAGTDQITAVGEAGAAQVQAVEDKGEEVLESIPEDYSELSSDVVDLKSSIGYELLSDTMQRGIITNGKWAQTSPTSSYPSFHVQLAVTAGDSITIKAQSSKNSNVGFWKEYSTPADGQSPTYSAATGYTSMKNVSSGTTGTFVVPDDCTYLYIAAISNNNNIMPEQVIVNGIDLTVSLAANLNTITQHINSTDATVSNHTAAIQDIDASVGFKKISVLQNRGVISNGVWAYCSPTTLYPSYHAQVPVSSGDAIAVRAKSNQAANVGFFTVYSEPVDGNAPTYSAAAGYTGIKTIQSNASGSFVVPADCTYLYVRLIYNNTDVSPQDLTINGVSIIKTVSGNLATLYEEIAALAENKTEIERINAKLDFLNLSVTNQRGCIDPSTKKWAYSTESAPYPCYCSQIPVNANDVITIKAKPTGISYICFLKSYSEPTDGTSVPFSDADGFDRTFSLANGKLYKYTVPADCTYIYILNTNNNTNVSPEYVKINDVDIATTIKGNIEELHQKFDTDVQWCVMGDSICYGYYSYFIDGGGSQSSTEGREEIGWTYLVEKLNYWHQTNIAVGGGGYHAQGAGGAARGYELARTTDFTPFNLVTIAYGTNDWSNNVVMGDMTDDQTAETITKFIPAMRATIEAIIASNPNCKIIVILPFNRKNNTADEAINWALGYEMSNSGTMEEFCQAMINVCNYYDIQYIDMSHYSTINRKNLPTLLPDGVHPSIECHKLLAKELSKKLTF